MNKLYRKHLLTIWCAVVALSLAACDSTQPLSYARLSTLAPPPAPLELMPMPDSPREQIWRPGYWDNSGNDFVWIPGELIARPDPTALWAPDHWVKHSYGWAFVPGYWQ